MEQEKISITVQTPDHQNHPCNRFIPTFIWDTVSNALLQLLYYGQAFDILQR